MAKQILPLSELENHVVIPAAFIKFGPKKKTLITFWVQLETFE